MSSDIILTSALKNNLQSLQSTKSVLQERGNSVSGNTSQDVIGQIAQDICCQNLSNRASNLTRLLDSILQSIKTLEYASDGLRKLTDLIKKAESIALESNTAVSNGISDLEQYNSQLDLIKTEIGNIVDNAVYSGTNLLMGNDLTTAFSDNERNHIITQGIDLTIEALELDNIELTSKPSIMRAIEEIRYALEDIQELSLIVADDLNIIQARQDFTQETITVLESGLDELNISSINEEGANLLALQTRQTLSTMSVSLASPTQKDILHLF